MRASHSRRRVAPGGWRALRREAHTFKRRSDALAAALLLVITVVLVLCLGLSALVSYFAGRLPPALQVIDDIRFNADYRRGSTFTAAVLAKNGLLFMGTDANGIFSYRTDSGWQGLWQQFTKASTNSGLVADNVLGLGVNSNQLLVAASSGLSSAKLDGTDWQSLISTSGFAPLGSTPPDRVRLSPSGRWLAVSTEKQGIGLYDTLGHDWLSLTAENKLLPADSVSVMEFDAGGNLWVGTTAGLLNYQIGAQIRRGSAALELHDETVVDVSFGADRIAALAADGKVFSLTATFDPTKAQWQSVAAWKQVIGSNGFTADAKLPQDLALAALTAKAVWVVTNTGAVGRYDEAAHDWQTFPPVSTSIKQVRDFLVSDESAFVATDAGLIDLSGNVLVKAPVRKLAFQDGHIWYLTDGAQIGYFDPPPAQPAPAAGSPTSAPSGTAPAVNITIVRGGSTFGPNSGAVALADVAHFVNDPDHLWMSIPGSGVGAYSLTTHDWQSVSAGLPTGIVPQTLVSISGNPGALLIQNNRTALYAYNGAAWTQISGPDQDVKAVAPSDSGLWYQTADNALFLTAGSSPQGPYFGGAGPSPSASSTSLASIPAASASSGALWVAQDDGKTLLHYDIGAHTWASYPQTAPISQIAALDTPDQSAVVLGGGQTTLVSSDGTPRAVLFGAPPTLPDGQKAPTQIVSATEFQNAIFFTTPEGQLYRYDQPTHTLLNVTPPDAIIQSVEATAGSVWAMGNGDLFQFSSGNWQAVNGLSGEPSRILPLGNALAILTVNNSLDWVNDNGTVAAQSVSGFDGLQDLTSIARAADGNVWFGSATHGLGTYSPDQHSWTTDETAGHIRALVALPDAVLYANDQGIYSFLPNSKDQVTEIEGDIRGLVDYGDHAWALILDKDGYGLYRRDGPSRWTAVRKPNSAPVDVTTITAVTRVGNRFVFGTSKGEIFDYNVASGQWRLIKGTTPISRVDWIGLNGDLTNDGRNSTIWALGPQPDSANAGRLVEIDTASNVSIKSPTTQNIVAATIGAGRIWYTDDQGHVSFLSEGQSQPTTPAGLLPAATPTSTQIPTATATATSTTVPSATPTIAATGPSTAAPTPTATLTKTPTATATLTLTPTLTIPQHLGGEPVKMLTMSGQTLWLATDTAIYQMQWDGTQITAQNRTDISKPVARLKVDDTGLLIAFNDGSAAHLANGTLTTVQGYDSTVLYSDTAWLWRLNGDHASAYFMGNEVSFTGAQPGVDQFQTVASDNKTLWLGGVGGAVQIDNTGLPTLYTPPSKGLSGTVQGIRSDGASWLASLTNSAGTTIYRRFDPSSSAWVDATSADYAKPVTALTIGPVNWQVTDQGVVPDPPSTIAKSRFPADVFTAIATDGKQLYAQTPVGFWVTATSGAFGTFTEDNSAFKQYFSGTTQTTLPAQGSPWHWTVSEDRATGQQTTKVTLSSAPTVARQFDAATGAFTDDEVLAVANDGTSYSVTVPKKATIPTPTAVAVTPAATNQPPPTPSSALWIATKGGLWQASISTDGIKLLALVAVGQSVSGLHNTSAGLLVHVDSANGWQLFKGGAFSPAPADASAAPRTILASDVLGTLLEQAPDGTFTLSNLVDAPHPGFWFDQVGAFAATADQLWISTSRGLVAYASNNGALIASRFDSLDQFSGSPISALAIGPLDSTKPDSASVLWALSGDTSQGKIWMFQDSKWTPAALANSPFVYGKTHPLPLPGDVQFTRSGDTVTPTLQGRAITWSNGRFDFDDIRDMIEDSGLWLATAGGPILLNGAVPCPVAPLYQGLPSNDLKQIGAGSSTITVRDGQDRAFTLDCSLAQPGWRQATQAERDAAFGKRQAVYTTAWGIGYAPESAKNAVPLAVAGLTDDQLFVGNRFSFDTVRDTTIRDDGLWLATAGGPVQYAAGAPDGSMVLALQGLSQPDTTTIRSDDSLRIGQATQTFHLNGQAWADDTATAVPVTDARLAMFDGGTWQSGPLPAVAPGTTPTLVAVKGAPPDYTLFVPSGKFSFDDVQDVTVTDGKDAATPGVVWLATTGGVMQGQAIGSIFHSSQLVAGGLCGIPDGIRVQDDKVFVGYNNRASGQFIGEPCTDLAPWQRDRQIVMPNSDIPLAISLTDGTLIGKRADTVLFRLTQTEQTAWFFGTRMSLDKAKLIDVIDDGGQAWLIFDNNLVELHKDVIQRLAGQ